MQRQGSLSVNYTNMKVRAVPFLLGRLAGSLFSHVLWELSAAGYALSARFCSHVISSLRGFYYNVEGTATCFVKGT